jgi:hypothetical protein
MIKVHFVLLSLPHLMSFSGRKLETTFGGGIMPRFGVCFSSLLVLTSLSLAQTRPSDPQAVALAAKAIAALTSGTSIADVTLTGNVTRTVGPDTESGNGTFVATASGQSRFDLDLDDGKISEIRSTANGLPVGSSTDKNGNTKPSVTHNCLTDASWFFPAFTSLTGTDPTLMLSYVGLEQRGGANVYHLRSSTNFVPISSSSNTAAATSQSVQLNTEDLYLDATTLLPISLLFNTYPDNNVITSIPVEIDFSSYQSVNGIVVPFHVQKYLNGSLLLDLTVTNVAVNSGVPSSDFSVQTQEGTL